MQKRGVYAMLYAQTNSSELSRILIRQPGLDGDGALIRALRHQRVGHCDKNEIMSSG